MTVTTNEKDKNFEDYLYNKNYLKIGFGAVSSINLKSSHGA